MFKEDNRSRSASDIDLGVTKDFIVVVNVLKEIKEAIRKMDEKMNSINRKVEILKNNQIDILGLKNMTSEIKI